MINEPYKKIEISFMTKQDYLNFIKREQEHLQEIIIGGIY